MQSGNPIFAKCPCYSRWAPLPPGVFPHRCLCCTSVIHSSVHLFSRSVTRDHSANNCSTIWFFSPEHSYPFTDLYPPSSQSDILKTQLRSHHQLFKFFRGRHAVPGLCPAQMQSPSNSEDRCDCQPYFIDAAVEAQGQKSFPQGHTDSMWCWQHRNPRLSESTALSCGGSHHIQTKIPGPHSGQLR